MNLIPYHIFLTWTAAVAIFNGTARKKAHCAYQGQYQKQGISSVVHKNGFVK